MFLFLVFFCFTIDDDDGVVVSADAATGGVLERERLRVASAGLRLCEYVDAVAGCAVAAATAAAAADATVDADDEDGGGGGGA